jgi:hypothetical protein
VLKRASRIAVIALLIAGQNGYARGVGHPRLLTFEGTLLDYSPHPRIHCGVLFIHQLARYHVDKIVNGKYAGEEIVVDQPACDGDVFKDVPVGSRVKLTVRVLRKYLTVTTHPGLRDDENPKIFYVAEGDPVKLEAGR